MFELWVKYNTECKAILIAQYHTEERAVMNAKVFDNKENVTYTRIVRVYA